MKTKLTKISVLLMVLAISIQLQAITESPRKALSFDGVNDNVSGTSGISTALTAITIEAWVYHNTLPAGAIQRYVTINPEVAVLRYDGSGSGGTNELHFYIKNSAGSIVSLRVNNVLSTGTWMHVAGTYDGTTMKLYLNGKLLKSGAAVGLTAPSGAFLFSSGAEAFNGKMDEVSVWNYARSVSDIREDMYRTSPTANANLLNYWKFNDATGTILTDSKGTATGTLNNMTNANWIASTIPFAAGAVNTQRVTTTGTNTFTGTGLSLNFTAKSSTDTIVASRIDTLANVSPTGAITAFNSQYWVINRFGTGTFTTNATFTVSEDITSGQAARFTSLKLYKRSGNGDGTWTLVATAASADAVNNTVTFNGLTSFDGQYMVCYEHLPNTVGSALHFDGTADLVDCGNAASLNITQAITIEAWINADTWKANSWEGTIVGKDDGNGTGYALRCGNNGMLNFVIGIGGAFHEVLSGSIMSTGRWNYVVGVYDGATMSVYVNGVLAGQQSITGSIGITNSRLYIGNSPAYPTRIFVGSIDEVRLFNAARTEAQIRSDMCNTLTGAETGLVNYWQFNNGSGSTLTDVVGGSNGTLTYMLYTECWDESYAMVVPVSGADIFRPTTDFTANWTAPAIGTVTSYKLDVSTNNTFTSLVSGYNNLDCGSNLSQVVTGLTNGTTYYYRVRADKTSVTGTGANHYSYTTVTPCNNNAINSQSTATQTKILNRTFNPITVTATGTNLTYQWFKNANAVNSGGTSLGSANGAQTYSYTPQSTTVGTLYYYCVVNGSCGTAQTSAISGAFIVNPYTGTYSGGTGTSGDPYKIANLGDLLELSETISIWNTGKYFIQTADIDATSTNTLNSGAGFSPIGNNGTNFTGMYDGQNHTITNLYISRSSTDYVGLFGYITGSGSEIKNVGLINVNITGGNYVGGLVGTLNGGGTSISNCYSTGSVSGVDWVGGLVGEFQISTIDNCYSKANVNGNSRVAGLVAYKNGGTLSNSHSTGNVNGNNTVGGLVSQHGSTNSLISNCYATGNITCSGAGVGGLVAVNGGTISNCYATGNVTGSGSSNYVGGLIGSHEGVEISNCYATGNVSGNNYVGGLNGLNVVPANNCYSTGSVSGSGTNVGGLIGSNEGDGEVNNCFWDTETSGKSTSSGGGTGLTTAQMKTQSPFTTSPSAWNFTAGSGVWKIENCANISYPYLQAITYDTPWASPAVNPIPGIVMIIPLAAISSQSTAGQTQTLNGTFTPITVTATGTNVTYQWYKNATASNSGGTSLGANNGAQTNSYTPQATKVGTLYYYCVVNGDCSPAQTTAVSGAFHVNPIAIAPAGSGTAGDPYRIANLNNLYYLSTTPGLWDQGYTYIQTANINAAETRNWDGGQGFVPLGISRYFRGHYHGKGNSIDSLYINRPGSQYVGFFGQVYWKNSYEKSTIDSLSLTNVNITGHSTLGGLVGYANGFNISHCSVIGGSVTATNSSDQGASGVGGMFGYISGPQETNNSTSHCFAAVAVSGQTDVGGFVGYTYGGYINQCYSAGPVSGTGYNIGGFCGERSSLGNVYTLDSSYYDIEASGQAVGVGHNGQPAYNHLQGKTTAEMKTQATYEGWNFSTVWKISGSVNNGYPYFDYPNTQISTATVSNIANNTATATGSINHIGALPITAHGFCWNTTGTPTLADAKVNLGATTTSADYSASINSFSHNTTYYLRAYLIDANDTIYGNVVNFTTTNTPMGGTCMKVPNNWQLIRIPDNNTLDLTNNYSIEAWINPDSGPTFTGDRMLIRKGIFPVSGYYLERTKTGNNLGLIFDDMVTADNILTAGKWNHIAAVNDNGTRHIYVNGVEYPLTGTPKTVIANSGPLIIGSGNKAGSRQNFLGKFDEISLWNTVLSQSQVRENMHFPLTGMEPGLVSYWQMDEGSDGTVSDKMGINNGILADGSSGIPQDDIYVVEPNPNPFWLVSTIPFGMGNSNTQVVTATGTNTFTTTGLAMNFTAKTGLDSIVVARIDSFPNINPTGLNAVFDRQYWAVHKYGTGTLTANLTFTISEGFTADDQSVPTKIKLYKRGSMADDSTWVYVASASTVNATTKQATFNGITGFSQYIITRGACGVYIPDANFRAALLANAGINTNGDGEIQCTEAAAYSGEINVTGGSIADMTGIEAFTSLTELYCADNTITSLNVSGLTSLTKLFCYNNLLTSLDVSTNTALVYLRCYQNQLASLDVSAIGTLLELSCNHNVLTNLDLSSNAALKTLNCQNNSLTSLNVKNGHNTSITTFSVPNNPGLSCIQVDDAIYSATRWFSKDAGAIYSTSCGTVTETPGIAKTVWSVYPNPVSDELIIEADNLNENTSFKIINSVGQVISAGTLMTKTHIQTSHFPMGIYLLKVENGKTFEIRKIVKK